MNTDLQNKIKAIIENNNVVLFMKGTADSPMCGFSAFVVKALNDLGVAFMDVNILSDDDLRQFLKVYSDWPTFPQLYVKGTLVGGCDIVQDMVKKDEFKSLFVEEGLLDV